MTHFISVPEANEAAAKTEKMARTKRMLKKSEAKGKLKPNSIQNMAKNNPGIKQVMHHQPNQ